MSDLNLLFKADIRNALDEYKGLPIDRLAAVMENYLSTPVSVEDVKLAISDHNFLKVNLDIVERTQPFNEQEVAQRTLLFPYLDEKFVNNVKKKIEALKY